MTLLERVQDDFSAGAFPGYSRDSIPANGVEDALDLLITDDGQLAGRGGGSVKSNADVGTPSAARFIWDGYLTPGLRTIYAPNNALVALAADDATPVNLGFYGFASLPRRKAAVLNGMVALPGLVLWGGSLKPVVTSAGTTVAVTNGSTTVVGTGTSWSTTVDPGMLFSLSAGTLSQLRPYVVRSVTDDTHLELTEVYQGVTAAGVGYGLGPLMDLAGALPMPDYGAITALAAVANKLVVCIRNRVYLSAIDNPWSWDATEYHELPAGVNIIGAEAVRDTLLLFTTAGMWAVSNVAYDLTDDAGNPQQRLEQINRDIVLWSWRGVATWGNSLVVPGTDGVYVVDTVSGPRQITGGINALYRSYVAAGYVTGFGSVVDEHYYLPILNSNAANGYANTFVDLLVCRLTPTRRGAAFGWTRFRGDGAKTLAVLPRAGVLGQAPYMIGADLDTGRVLTLNYRTPSVTATDPDGSSPDPTIVTRELTGDVPMLVKKARVNYELEGSGATVTAEWAQGDGAYTALATAGAVNTDPTTKAWRVGKRNPHFRISVAGAYTKFVLHALTIFIRPSARR